MAKEKEQVLNVDIIRESFELAKPIGKKVVAKFYEFLLQDYPQAKGLFKDLNMEQQKMALLNSLVYIVDHIDKPEALQNYLFKMGQRHTKYGAEEEHYDWVGASLLKTFAFFFKEAWTKELQAQWTIAYQYISSVMIEGQRSVGAQPAVTPSVDLRERATAICHALMMEIIENEFKDEEVVEAIREKVRATIRECLDEEGDRIVRRAA